MRHHPFPALVLALALSACNVSVRTGVDAAAGSDVEHTVQVQIGRFLNSYDPTLRIGAASCPAVVETSPKPSPICTLTVDGIALPIVVDASDVKSGVKVALDGGFFERSKLDGSLESTLLALYGLKGAVRCPGALVEELQYGAIVTCPVAGLANVTSMRFKVDDNRGGVFIYVLPGVRQLDPIPAGLLSAHKRGETSILTGTQAATFLRQELATSDGAHLVGAVISCPASLDLTGTRTANCAIRYPAMAAVQHIRFVILPVKGLDEIPIDVPLDRAKIAKMAKVDLDERMSEIGGSWRATIDCGKGYIVVPVGGSFDCKMTSGPKKYRLVVDLQDIRGTVSWHGVPL